MASTFLSDTFADVNTALNTFVTNFSTGIASEIAPLVGGFLTLSFIILGIMAVRGLLDSPFLDVAVKMLKVSIIVSIALSAPLFQKYIIDVLLTLPDDLVASVVSKSVTGTPVIAGQGAAQAIEQLFDLGCEKAGMYFDAFSIGIMPGSSTNLMPLVEGLMVFIGTLLCVIMGTLWLFIAKVVLALMLGVAPIFIVMLAWQPTQQYFFSWLNTVFNTVITTIFVIAIFSIFIAIFNVQLNALEVTQDTANFSEAASYSFLGLLCLGVLMTIPHYVSQLTSAAAGAVGSAVSNMMSKAGGTAATTGSAITGGTAGAVRSGFAASSAKNAFKEARNNDVSRFGALRGARHEFNKSMSEMKQGYPDYFRKQKSNTQK